jgi:hypothetical protein
MFEIAHEHTGNSKKTTGGGSSDSGLKISQHQAPDIKKVRI